MKTSLTHALSGLIKITIILGLAICGLVSCNNPLNSGNSNTEAPVVTGSGALSAQIFLPDYAKLAKFYENRAIAPQSARLRLSTSSDGASFTEIDTLNINTQELEPVPGAPGNLPGGIWRGSFQQLNAGSYDPGKIKVELLDNSDTLLTSGTNQETIVIASHESTRGIFFTTPVTTESSGTLVSGEMRFGQFSGLGGKQYRCTLTVTGTTYPDIVFFKSDGTYHSYRSIDDPGDAQFDFPVNGSGEMSYFFGVWADDGPVDSWNIAFTENGDLVLTIIDEDFETGDFSKYPWVQGGAASITSSAVEQPSNRWFGNDGKFLKLKPDSLAAATLSLEGISLDMDSALSFKYKDAMVPDYHIFNVYIDGAVVESRPGVYPKTGAWQPVTILVPAGIHSIKFEVPASGYTGSGGGILNAVYLDDITVAPDVTVGVMITPNGDQETYAGGFDIPYTAKALRSDGTVREGRTVTFSGSGTGGSVSSTSGVFSPSGTGSYRIKAVIDGVQGTAAGSIRVHPADYLRRDYWYPGTGVTYGGYTGAEGTLTTSGGVTVTYPAAQAFTADGFFTLEGTVDNSAVYNYAYVEVTKDSDPDTLQTYYLVRDTFKTRIWLRFGPGDYTVKVHGLIQILLSPDLGAEGDYLGCWHYGSSITFNVTNTRDDGAGAGGLIPDRRFIYPSYINQSDDFRVTNLAGRLTYGLTDDIAKIKAIHDYIISNTVYDADSFPNVARRKKQDALTVLKTRYTFDSQYDEAGGHFLTVCEGYANVCAALIRAAGIEAQYIASGEPLNHGWDNIYVGGGWKLFDPTWDDPVRNSSAIGDYGPAYIGYDNFLLPDLTGNNHTGGEVENGRYLIDGSKVPRQKGVPDGWY
ncbi:MAG: transglutaminase-like domain-containing protein [Treponema sp.]|jgi:transglutaminase-like putative cysteine protease|nr:transglutaminase-like domain-containing protein [Treponema sp.]